MKHITTIIAVLTLCLITTGAALANQLHPVSGCRQRLYLSGRGRDLARDGPGTRSSSRGW